MPLSPEHVGGFGHSRPCRPVRETWRGREYRAIFGASRPLMSGRARARCPPGMGPARRRAVRAPNSHEPRSRRARRLLRRLCTYSSSTLCRQPAAQYSSTRRQYGSAPFMPRIRAITSGVLNRLRKPHAIRPAECLKLGSVFGTLSVYAGARRLHVAGPASATSARSAGKSSGTRPSGLAFPSANSAA